MGLFERLGGVVTGIGGAIQAPFGFAKDLAVGAFTDDDEFDGIVGTLWGSLTKRGGQVASNLLGPEEGLGAVVGGLPGAVRRPVRTVTDPIFEGLEWAGREIIREPLTAAVTAASLAEAGEGFDLREGYRIAQDRSLGQAMALAVLTDDITDETEVAKAMGSDWYDAISGTADAIARLTLEPDILVGKFLVGARRASVAGDVATRTVRVRGRDIELQPGLMERAGAAAAGRGLVPGGRAIRTGKDLDAALLDPRMADVNEKILAIRAGTETTEQAAAQIRDLAFHDHKHGDIIATVLAEADDLNIAWGALMGRRRDIDALAETRADLAGRIDRSVGTQAKIAHLRRMGFELPAEVNGVDAALARREVDALYDTDAKLLAFDESVAMVRDLPGISKLSETRRNITRSDFYQENWMAAPLRLATNMRPRNMVSLTDTGGDIQVARLLRKAGVADELQDQLRGEYMAATDASARNAVMAKAEAEAIRSIAAKHGVDPESIETIVQQAARNNKFATQTIAESRQYDGAGRSYIEHKGEDGVMSKIYVPLARTQEFAHYLTADLDAIDRVMKDAGGKAKRFNMPVAQVMRENGNELLENFNRLWKPSVLLRVGWPIRVVGEEQLRIMSQIGALLTMGRTLGAGSRFAKDATINVLARVNDTVKRVPRDQRIARDPRLRGLNLGMMNIDGWDMERAFGTPENMAQLHLQMNSAKGALDSLWGAADEELRALRKDVTGEWASIDALKDPESHTRAWVHAVNAQIGTDTMWKQFLQGKTVDEVGDWIRNTSEGRTYMKSVPHWKNRIDDWLEIAKQTADDYLPTDELRQLALQGRATPDDLVRAMPDAGTRPPVNGAILADIKGGTKLMNAVGKLRDKAMKTLGTIPTDVLSRQPYFDWHYTQEVRRLVRIAGDQGIDYTPELATKFAKQARDYALGESKRLLYDLADESELAHMLRFISPFYNASQEVITRWTGIAVQNPPFVSRLNEIWRSPEKAGIVQDEDGNTIAADGTYATNALGERVEPGKERFLNMRLLASDNVLGKALFNDLTRNLPGVKTIENARFNKDSFNTIVQMPGTGPLVALPLNEIAKGRPELEESLKWALPFGATQNTLDIIMPATAKRIRTVTSGEEDRAYANTVTRAYLDMLVDYNLQKRAEKPTYAEAKRKADEFWKMRTIASFVSPVAPSFQSPYQLYIDKYRALLEKDPSTADEIFLRDEGPEFFPLTQSLTKTMNGIPPTVEGKVAEKKYADLIERHPDFGGLIVGEEGAGEFASSVYQSQLTTPLRPGSGEMQRRALSFEEVSTGPDKKLAWQEYGRFMDLIEAERIKRGLPNLQVRGAQDLATIKRQFIEQHGAKHPEWYADLNVVDRGAWNKKLTALTEIAADDRLAGREEIARLRQYMDARKIFVAELARREAAGGSATMNAASNMDLAGLWGQITGKLVEQSLPFGDLFYRYLERDPMTPEPQEVAA